MDVVKKVHFEQVFMFIYSRRKGTVADKMTGQVQEQVKAERSDELMALEAQLGENYRKQFLSCVEEVLFEECTIVDGQACQIGYNERYVRIAVKTEEDLSNQIKQVTIMECAKEQETLFATIV